LDISPGQIVKMELYYQRDTGYLTIQGIVPPQIEELTIMLKPQQQGLSPLNAVVKAVNNQIFWKSRPISTGTYLLSISSPNLSIPIPNQLIKIVKKSNVNLQLPPIKQKGSIQISADSSQAIYTLTTEEGVLIGQGKGYQYLFKDLDPGNYILQFSN